MRRGGARREAPPPLVGSSCLCPCGAGCGPRPHFRVRVDFEVHTTKEFRRPKPAAMFLRASICRTCPALSPFGVAASAADCRCGIIRRRGVKIYQFRLLLFLCWCCVAYSDCDGSIYPSCSHARRWLYTNMLPRDLGRWWVSLCSGTGILVCLGKRGETRQCKELRRTVTSGLRHWAAVDIASRLKISTKTLGL